jgi:glyoxylase I family protein
MGHVAKTAEKPPFALEGIDHILLLVSGMAPAVRFYTEVLGCTIEDRLPQYDMLQLRAGAALMDLVDIAAPEAIWGKAARRRRQKTGSSVPGPRRPRRAALRRHLARHRVEIVEESVHGGSRGESHSTSATRQGM